MTIDPVVAQAAGELIPNLSEGQALIYVGTYIALTMITFKLKSAIGLFVWALTGVVLVMTMVGLVSAPFYWGVLALSLIGSVASAIWTVNNV